LEKNEKKSKKKTPLFTLADFGLRTVALGKAPPLAARPENQVTPQVEVDGQTLFKV